jgi:hypothetical protein
MLKLPLILVYTAVTIFTVKKANGGSVMLKRVEGKLVQPDSA